MSMSWGKRAKKYICNIKFPQIKTNIVAMPVLKRWERNLLFAWPSANKSHESSHDSQWQQVPGFVVSPDIHRHRCSHANFYRSFSSPSCLSLWSDVWIKMTHNHLLTFQLLCWRLRGWTIKGWQSKYSQTYLKSSVKYALRMKILSPMHVIYFFTLLGSLDEARSIHWGQFCIKIFNINA